MVKRLARSPPRSVTLKALERSMERWEFRLEEIASVWWDGLPPMVRYKLLLIAHSIEAMRLKLHQQQRKAVRR